MMTYRVYDSLGRKPEKKRRQPWPRCVHPGERERETCWRDSFIRLSHVSCCCTGRYDGATPNSGWPVREIQALSKKGISLPTWATHAKKTHTRERRRDTLPPNNSSPQGRTDRWWWWVRRCTRRNCAPRKKENGQHTHTRPWDDAWA